MEFWFSEFHTPDVKHSIRVNKQLYSKQSDYQRIDIFETPEFGRVLTLDGNVMLTERDEFIYDEMIVHVPMAVHREAKDILVIGAGDGGVVRELTRYDRVERIDLVEMDADIYYDQLGKDMRVEPIPEDMVDLANEYREKLLDAVSMFDDEIMELYLEGKEIPTAKIRAAIRQATCAVEMVPVTCGSSYRNKGVQKLLDAIVDYMPAPTDVPAIKGVNPKTDEEEERKSSDDEPFAALAFKIMTDPYVGRLSFFRVYSGTLTTGSSVLNATKGKRERMGRILQMHANHREDIESVYSGDIAAVVGLKNTTTGDTLCDEKHPIILESMEFPEPVIRVAIEPKTKAGQEKMSVALAKLAEEDPTFRTYTDEETGQTIIAGMGELHLEIIVDRLLREFKVEANVGAPQVAYKETIRKAVEDPAAEKIIDGTLVSGSTLTVDAENDEIVLK